MLSVNRVTKSFGMQLVLKDVSFSVNSGERLGLVGANGSGKTTLMRIIAGLERPDSGTVRFNPSNLRVGYLAQGFDLFGEQTLGEYLDAIQGGAERLGARLEDLAARLADRPEDRSLQEAYDETLAGLAAAGQSSARAESILPALGLWQLPRSQAASTLSGGQKTRLALAGVLVSAPQLLLLDEPTNHLDLGMLDWLEEWLLNQQGAVLMVSHDRAFLDHSANGILELDGLAHSIKYYGGNYTGYQEQRLPETEVRRLLSFYLFTNDEVFTPVGKLSFGEQARLSLACLVAQGCNLLLLDEPTNHLDIPARTRFEDALEAFEGTLLVISHDRYFIGQFASQVWEMDGQKVRMTLMEPD